NNDYVFASGTVTIAPYSLSNTFAVTVNGDLVYEPEETFTVALSNPVNGVLADPTGQCTIQKPPTLDTNLWVVDGYPSTTSVNAMQLVGDTLYVGGSFVAVGPNTGSGVPIDAVTGVPPATFPRIYSSSG